MAETDTAANPDTTEPCNILVVDDEPDLEQLMKQRMRREIRRGTYSFEFAGNGVEALEKLSENPQIEIVLSDINMPKMDGLTLLEHIPDVNENIRSVIISAYGDMRNIRLAMNRGAFDFITKPVDFEDLKVTIDRTYRHLLLWRDAVESRDKLVLIQNELNIAGTMQQGILPTEFPRTETYQLFARMEPARQIGGDFYDVVQLENGQIGFTIADVSGKGVPAALFMMSARTYIKGSAVGHKQPEDVLAEANNMLEDGNDSMMFVTLLYAVYDPPTRRLKFANAGHNLPVIYHADGSVSDLPSTSGVALGLVPDMEFERGTIQLEPGDVLLLYTDGVNEAENANLELFEMDRVRELYNGEPPPLDAEKIIDHVFSSVRTFAGSYPQSDDITCMALCIPK